MRRATLPGVLLATRTFLICLILLSIAQAVNPPPDGGYPGQNTAAGTNALFRLTDGTGNTALGSGALQNDTDGHSNTAVGAGALDNNRRGNQNTATGLVALESSRSTMDPTIQLTDIALSAIIMVAAIQPSVGTHLRMFLKALRPSLSVTRPVKISPTPVPTILTLATSVALAITESFALATQTR